MGSSLNDNIGMGHIVSGVITASAGTLAALTSNDASATLTRNNAGDYTVTFGDTFLSAPVVTCSLLDATLAATDSMAVLLQSVATNAVRFNITTTTGTTVAVALADSGDVHFLAFGKRNN